MLHDLFQGTKRKDSMDSDTSRGGDNKMTNQFSFLERATQTMNNAKKVTLEDLFRYKLPK